MGRRRRGGFYSDNYFAGPFGLIFAVAVLVAVCFGLIWGIGKFNEHAEKQTGAPSTATPSVKPKGGARIGGGSGSSPRALPAPPPPAKPAVDRAANDLNIAIAAREVARLRGDGASASYSSSRAYEAKARLDQASVGESYIPEHLLPVDEIIAVDDVDLRKMKPVDAAAHLASRVDRISPGTFVKFRVHRYEMERDHYVYFTREVSLASVSASGSDRAGGRVRITNELAQQIQREVLSLDDRSLGRAERKQIVEILGRGEASAEEFEMISRRIASDVSGQMEREKESFKSQIAALRKMLETAPVPDVAVTKDGRRIAGTLTAESESSVTIETPYARVTVKRPELAHLYTHKELREQFEGKLVGAREHLEAYPQALVWTRDWHMPVHREYVAYLMLELDPHDRNARMAAGYYSSAGGKWVLGQSIASGGKPPVRKAETRGELQAELEAMGFVFMGSRWYTRASWGVSIDTLHKPTPLKVSMTGVAITPWHEKDVPQARLFNPTAKYDSPARLRFIAPAAAAGSVTIGVDAPAEIFQCEVKVSGTVLEQKKGTIEVLVTPDGGQPRQLYAIDGGGHETFMDITPFVRGKKRFSVIARLTTTQDTYKAYTRFLESLPDSTEVFSVRGMVLQPMPDIDRTWTNTRP